MRSFGTIRLKSRSSLNDRLVLEGVVFKNLLLWEKREGTKDIKDALKAVKIREGLNVAVLSGPERGL